MLTFATQITIARLLLVPVFCWFAAQYSMSMQAGDTHESLRWIAVGIYIVCAVADGLDGYIARRFHQRSRLGSILDPLADKALLLAGLIILCLYPWGLYGWQIPAWFVALILARDAMILAGICILYPINGRVPIRPHWTGKVCTVCQMLAIGWTMLKPLPISPLYPAILAAIFTVWSGIDYFLQGWRQLPSVTQRGSAPQK